MNGETSKGKPLIRLLFACGFAGFSLTFGFLYYDQYFKKRDCFNEIGRCLDPETGVVFHEQSGAAWLSLAAMTFALAIYQFWAFRKQQRRLHKAG